MALGFNENISAKSTIAIQIKTIDDLTFACEYFNVDSWWWGTEINDESFNSFMCDYEPEDKIKVVMKVTNKDDDYGLEGWNKTTFRMEGLLDKYKIFTVNKLQCLRELL